MLSCLLNEFHRSVGLLHMRRLSGIWPISMVVPMREQGMYWLDYIKDEFLSTVEIIIEFPFT